ncbi:MAG: Fic family protein [Peptococcaceae bacterium]|nr:Fic family protein [Peptococcaceae bacterium]
MFVVTRAGSFVQNLSGDAAYWSFRPAPLPPEPELKFDDEMRRLLVETSRQLTNLARFSLLIPSTDLFIPMYIRKEALLSSQIEGTPCTLEDILDPELNTAVNLEAGEVINYVKATQFALEQMRTLPLCNQLLRETHAVLMTGVRGKEKNSGEFRRSQNWIGAAGCSLKDARYIPPNVEDMTTALTELEQYINEDSPYPPLIDAALIHYQFETIHPFLDGNGHIGRLLILLYFIEKSLLTKPVIYVSYFLKKNQREYYDRISEVRRAGNYEQWVRFFLEAVNAAAVDATETIWNLSELHNINAEKLPVSKRKQDNIRRLFTYIEEHPIIDIKHTAADLALSYNTVAHAVKKLQELEILHETTNAARNRVFAYEDYLDILRQDT